MHDIPRLVAASSGQQLHILNTHEYKAGTPVSTITSLEYIHDATWNHNGQVVAICHDADATSGNSVTLYAASSGELVSSFGNEKFHSCQRVGFAGKSRLLCCTCTQKKTLTTIISVWDLKRMIEVRRFEETRSKFLSSSMDQSDQFVYCLAESSFSMYLLKENKKVGEVELSSQLAEKYVCFDAISTLEENLVALGDNRGTVTIYHLQSVLGSNFNMKFHFRVNLNLSKVMNQSKSYESGESTNINASILRVSFSGELLAILMSTGLVVYNWLNQVIVAVIKATSLEDIGGISSFCWDGAVVALGFSSGKVAVLDWRTQRIFKIYQLQSTEGHRLPVTALAFSPEVERKEKTLSSEESNFDRNDPGEEDNLSPKDVGSSIHTNNMMSEGKTLHQFEADKVRQESTKRPQHVERVVTVPTVFPENEERLVSIFSLEGLSGVSGEQEIEMTINPFGSNEGLSQSNSNEGAATRNMIDVQFQNSIRNEIKQEIATLRLEMLRQFQIQSDEMKDAMSKQLNILERMADENQSLRQENQRLRELLDRSEND